MLSSYEIAHKITSTTTPLADPIPHVLILFGGGVGIPFRRSEPPPQDFFDERCDVWGDGLYLRKLGDGWIPQLCLVRLEPS